MTQRLKGKIRQADTIVAQTVKIGSGLSLGDLSDVSIEGQTDGVMMIFNGATGKYEVSTQINNENLNIIGGTY
jgi:hypothetical protein